MILTTEMIVEIATSIEILSHHFIHCDSCILIVQLCYEISLLLVRPIKRESNFVDAQNPDLKTIESSFQSFSDHRIDMGHPFLNKQSKLHNAKIELSLEL